MKCPKCRTHIPTWDYPDPEEKVCSCCEYIFVSNDRLLCFACERMSVRRIQPPKQKTFAEVGHPEDVIEYTKNGVCVSQCAQSTPLHNVLFMNPGTLAPAPFLPMKYVSSIPYTPIPAGVPIPQADGTSGQIPANTDEE